MIAPARPQDPATILGRAWNALYETGYASLRVAMLLIARPLFQIRTVGRVPRIPRGGVIFCANHASYLDPAFIQLIVRRRVVFVMSNDFYRRPLARWFFRLVGAIPVGTGRFARDGLERAVALLRRGQAVGIFPEGRLSLDGSIGEAQRGVAIMARMGGAPVQTIGLAGNLQAWPRGARWLRQANVRASFGPLIPAPPAQPPQGRQEEQAFADAVLTSVARAREVARADGRRTGARGHVPPT